MTKHWSHYHRTKETTPMLSHDEIELLKRVVGLAATTLSLLVIEHADCGDSCRWKAEYEENRKAIESAKELLERLENAE